MLKNEWLLDHVSECTDCVVERTNKYAGVNCFTCGHVLTNYEEQFVVKLCHPYKSLHRVVCYACRTRIQVIKNRRGAIESFTATATQDFRKEVQKFIERIKNGNRT